MRIYCPNTKEGQHVVGGGWTFLRNFRKAMAPHAQFVESWREAECVFVTGVTMADLSEVREAHEAGVPIVFRVDNVPRKSRNRRSTPHERMRELAEMATVVVYQSEWAKRYCFPLCGDGTVVYNGVDTDLFRMNPDALPPHPRYLFAYHGKNEQKGFWTAHLLFQMEARRDREAEFFFVNDFGRDGPELAESNYDFWNGEKHLHLPRYETPEEMVTLMQSCTHLIYPAVCDASPNVVLEARACGLTVVGAAPRELAGTQELLDLPFEDIGLERMGHEYAGIIGLAIQNV